MIAALAAAATVTSACPRSRPPSTCKPATPDQTRNRILARTSPDTLLVFVGTRTLWVMGSAVSRLTGGAPPTSEVAEGVHEPLLKALIQEARHKDHPVAKINIYAAAAVPEATVKLVAATARASRIGRVLTLPWELLGAGTCTPVRHKASSAAHRSRPEPRLSADNPLVIRANAAGIWINGQPVLRLAKGRLPAKPSRGTLHFEPSHAALVKQIRARLKKITVERWRLLVVVTPDVANKVVQMILSAAGTAGIAQFKLERELDP